LLICEVAVNIQDEAYCSGIKTLSAKYMKPSNLIRNLETKHPNHAKKSLEFFRHREASLKRQRHILTEVSTKKTGIILSRTWNYQVKKRTLLEKRLWNPVCWKQQNNVLENLVRQT